MGHVERPVAEEKARRLEQGFDQGGQAQGQAAIGLLVPGADIDMDQGRRADPEPLRKKGQRLAPAAWFSGDRRSARCQGRFRGRALWERSPRRPSSEDRAAPSAGGSHCRVGSSFLLPQHRRRSAPRKWKKLPPRRRRRPSLRAGLTGSPTLPACGPCRRPQGCGRGRGCRAPSHGAAAWRAPARTRPRRPWSRPPPELEA